MSKKELIWLEILSQAIDDKKFDFTQKAMAEKFGLSLSTVFNALKIPRQLGAVKVTGRNFSLADTEKLLYLWATQRNFKKEIIYETYSPLGPKESEGLMPAGIIFAAYSAYAQKYNDAPADYDKVYVYAGSEELAEIKNRFPKQPGSPNVFVLKKNELAEKYKLAGSDAQMFCDFWNLSDWYAKEFLKKLKEKILNQ
ncbi:MAG: hypothetical protein UW11_C0011G0021 [Parcubacteria group bacterium GW2011_GWA2_43_9b]|nr:MAG: hypothetical protein UW11_C0011G0021 [Parcubacteria group bacterium GW2011_GWA2_43_9b]